MKSVCLSLLIAVMALSSLFHAQQVDAQGPSGVELENVVALINFGEGINFVATVKSSLPVLDASIVILDESQGFTHVEPLIVQADGRTEFHYNTRQNPLRPFSPVSWNYRFTLSDGNIVQSDVFSAQYDDNRFDWQMLESGMLRVHWYGGDAGFGRAALNTAQSGLEAVGRLIPAEVTRPVDFYIYASLDDLRGTLVPGSQEWIAGHADPSLGLVMVAIEPGPEQEITMKQRIPHEMMHVMLYRAVGEGYRNIPAWLNEGTAGLAELVYNSAYELALRDAIARSDWIPLNTLCNSFPEDTDRAILAYAEARSFASFLHEKYGTSGLINLAKAYASGADCDHGPEAAFGVPLSSLEADWHASLAGETPLLPALESFTPYLVLLCAILFAPLIGIAGAMRKKGKQNEPETYIRK